jgi:hypothetical protein
MKRQVAFLPFVFIVAVLGGQRLACAHDSHLDTHNVPPAAGSDSSFVALRPELTKSVARISTGAGIIGFAISGELPESCICCGSSHEAATVANATFFDQKKRGAPAAASTIVPRAAAAFAAQATTLTLASEHGPPSASVQRHLLIGILLI